MTSTQGPIVSDPAPGLPSALVHAAYELVWLLLLLVSAPWWLARSLLSGSFRRAAAERATLSLPELRAPKSQRVLVHAVSVGEVRAAAPVVRALAARRPDLELVLSTTTSTGAELARATFPELPVVRFPLDAGWMVRRFLGRVRPSLVILAELELWPSFLRACNRAGVPVAVVNGRMTERSFGRYLLLEGLLPQVARLSLFCAQREEYRERYVGLGGSGERAVVTGNTKVDGLRAEDPDPAGLEELRGLLAPADRRPMIAAGSTHTSEEAQVARAWRAGAPEARLVLVPRYPARAAEVRADLAALGLDVQLLSELRSGALPDPALPAVVDTIGELERVYRLADLAFVGGTLVPRGGQNVLEPAAAGRAVVHGPGVRNFAQEVDLLERAGASRPVADETELAAAFRELAADRGVRERMGAAGRAVVEGQRGATAITVDALEERCLGRSGAGARAATLAAR